MIYICDSGVVGNARPCQGRDRGFEPRLSLLFFDGESLIFKDFFHAFVNANVKKQEWQFFAWETHHYMARRRRE